MIKQILLSAIYFAGTLVYAQNIEGRVISSLGEPIAFVNVQLLNTNNGTMTDSNGNYRLNVNTGNYQISFSYVGFATVVKSITLTRNESENLNVVLIEQTEALSQVVVTAEKRETILQQTPIAATVLDAENLKQTRAWSFSDVTALAPSLLTTEHGGSTSSLFINIRGVMGLHSQTAVATYVDGIYQFEGFAVPLTFNNVDNIEVLRGPQGTLYGRNAFGGVINIKTKQPTNTSEGHFSVSYGNFEQQRYQASYSAPIVNNKLFAGVTAQFDQREGVYQNTVTGDNFDRPQSVSGGLNLRYLANDKLDLTFNGRFERNEDFGSYAWVRSDSILFAEPYTVGRDRRNIELRNNHSVSVKINRQASTFDIQSITAYQSYERGFPELLDVDFSPANTRAARNDFDIDTFTQELRLSSKASKDVPYHWTLGSFAFIAPKGTRDNAFITFSDEGEIRAENENRFDDKGIAFYGQGNYALDAQWEATFGLRYDIENQRLLQELRTVDTDGSVEVTQPFKNFESTFEAFTPKFILNYKPTENTIVYAQYARGFRPGGLNTNSPNESDVPFNPEYSNNYEIGIKNTFFDNKLKFNITGFFLQQRDQQIAVIEDSFFLKRNTGNVDNLGAEIELEAIPLKGLQLIWNASVSHAEYKELLIADSATRTNLDLSGNKPLFNPPFVSFTSIQYTKEFNSDLSTFIRGEHRYTGEHFFNFDNEVRQSPYNLYNARIGGKYRNIELAFWARNLTERKYRTWATGVFLLGSPRFYGATLIYDF